MNFWQHHSVLFLICAVAFPRLTLFFGTGLTDTFGVGGWLAWLILPRFQIAFFATAIYGAANPFLVAVSWLVAVSCLGGTGEATRRAA